MMDGYFDLLEDWKQLPSYKLETRIDSIVEFALPRVLENVYGIKTRIVIPEFPIRLGTLYPELEDKISANRSYKVDFYVRTQPGENLFIEFKSATGSRRESQDNYLQRSVQEGMKAIIEGILKVCKATSHRRRYVHLLEKLRSADLIDQNNKIQDGSDAIQIMYIQPRDLGADQSEQILDFRRLARAIRDCFADSYVMDRLSSALETWAFD